MQAVVLLVLLLVPLVFVRGAEGAFEPHKVALAATGAAILGAVALARLFSRIEAEGLAATLRAAGSRARRSFPASVAVLSFLLSSLLSTLFSVRPGVSLHGSWGRPAGFVTALALTTIYFASRRLALAFANPGH